MTTYGMRTNWQTLKVSPETPVQSAMMTMDRARLGLVLVVDEDGRLLGTVTDGDVRRAILRQVTLDTPVSEVMNRNFTALRAGATAQDALDLMQEMLIKHVPVLDDKDCLLGLFYLQDLIGAPYRSNWAVVMAGGEGRRLRPLTENTPKPMLPVGDQPVLELIVRHLVRYGFRRIFISINYLGAQIEAHFGNGLRFGCTIEYLRESRPLGTGGALTLLPELPSEPLLVINGDLVTDINLAALLDYHERCQHAATLGVREFRYQIPYGVVRTDESRVISMEEKPVYHVLVNAGVYVLEPFLLQFIPSDQSYPLPNLLDEARVRGYAVGAFPIREYWVDIGHLEEYERVRSNMT